jgi:hypothetical protein
VHALEKASVRFSCPPGLVLSFLSSPTSLCTNDPLHHHHHATDVRPPSTRLEIDITTSLLGSRLTCSALPHRRTQRHVDGVLGIDFRRPGPSLLATDPFSVVRTDPGRPSSSSALISRAPQQDAHLAASKQREGQQQQIESQLPVPSQPSQVPPTCGSCALTPAAFPNLWLPRTSHALVPDRASLKTVI